MRIPVPCAYPRPCPPLAYGWLARRTHALCAWLLLHFGQPALSEEETFLAAATDHADCERRQRWLATQHQRTRRSADFV
ncbi:MAG TPA: hypothetical protein VH105_06285 [Burkholderiales bacterium]|jgi:hypothetical protein|nr:hypothetical protein [Burkholderiales bacterium]